jgi:hypothetical protein
MKKLISALLLLLSFDVKAVAYVEIDDASKLLWQMQAAGFVYFRNLNEFDANQAGCCYAYYLDTTTAGGKALWTVILIKIAEHKRINLAFSDVGSNASAQPLIAIGRYEHGINQ